MLLLNEFGEILISSDKGLNVYKLDPSDLTICLRKEQYLTDKKIMAILLENEMIFAFIQDDPEAWVIDRRLREVVRRVK